MDIVVGSREMPKTTNKIRSFIKIVDTFNLRAISLKSCLVLQGDPNLANEPLKNHDVQFFHVC